jgi:hypothetical protein
MANGSVLIRLGIAVLFCLVEAALCYFADSDSNFKTNVFDSSPPSFAIFSCGLRALDFIHGVRMDLHS